jgi:hypothetical protein
MADASLATAPAPAASPPPPDAPDHRSLRLMVETGGGRSASDVVPPSLEDDGLHLLPAHARPASPPRPASPSPAPPRLPSPPAAETGDTRRSSVASLLNAASAALHDESDETDDETDTRDSDPREAEAVSAKSDLTNVDRQAAFARRYSDYNMVPRLLKDQDAPEPPDDNAAFFRRESMANLRNFPSFYTHTVEAKVAAAAAAVAAAPLLPLPSP